MKQPNEKQSEANAIRDKPKTRYVPPQLFRASENKRPGCPLTVVSSSTACRRATENVELMGEVNLTREISKVK
jgi:hypothetical protein